MYAEFCFHINLSPQRSPWSQEYVYAATNVQLQRLEGDNVFFKFRTLSRELWCSLESLVGRWL